MIIKFFNCFQSLTNTSTPLHKALLAKNEAVFSLLLDQPGLHLELQNSDGHTILWLALQAVPAGQSYDEHSFASRLLKCGSSPNAVKGDTGRLD